MAVDLFLNQEDFLDILVELYRGVIITFIYFIVNIEAQKFTTSYCS